MPHFQAGMPPKAQLAHRLAAAAPLDTQAQEAMVLITTERTSVRRLGQVVAVAVAE
jgi:hypothetical protein